MFLTCTQQYFRVSSDRSRLLCGTKIEYLFCWFIFRLGQISWALEMSILGTTELVNINFNQTLILAERLTWDEDDNDAEKWSVSLEKSVALWPSYDRPWVLFIVLYVQIVTVVNILLHLSFVSDSLRWLLTWKCKTTVKFMQSRTISAEFERYVVGWKLHTSSQSTEFILAGKWRRIVKIMFVH